MCSINRKIHPLPIPRFAPFQTQRGDKALGLSPGILKWVKLIDNFEGEYDYVTNEGTVFTFKTNRHSPNYRLINIDFTDPEESKWKVLVPEHEKDVLGKSAARKLCCLSDEKVKKLAHLSLSGDR